ncbi:MAG TPA: hypothetical protein VMR52_04035 [Dehalococcoidia bacterium]|nr:hypothetical protein [Dehalococcoidia bacterium]
MKNRISTNRAEREYECIRRSQGGSVNRARLSEGERLGTDRAQSEVRVGFCAGSAIESGELFGFTGWQSAEIEVKQRTMIGWPCIDERSGESKVTRPGQRIGGSEAIVAREDQLAGGSGIHRYEL